jgi:hypothetical protein
VRVIRNTRKINWLAKNNVYQRKMDKKKTRNSYYEIIMVFEIANKPGVKGTVGILIKFYNNLVYVIIIITV